MRKLTVLLVLLMFSGLQVVFAQRTVSGRVTTTGNTAIAGVTVQVKGTAIGNITDSDGRFSIAVPNNDAILLFSFVGYSPKEVAVGTQPTISIILEEASMVLNEVVVTALGI